MPVSEAQKKASVKYLEKLDEIRIRMPKGKKEIIQTAAAAVGESVNGYINGAIDSRMGSGGPQESAEAHEGGAGIPVSHGTLKVAQSAAEAAGEALPVFVTRAVETQAERDKIARKMKKPPAEKPET